MNRNRNIKVQGKLITIASINEEDYISLTDMAKSQYESIVITKWISNKYTISFLGAWEAINNPNFNYTEFGIIKNESGMPSYVLSIKEWTERTNAIGLRAKTGRYGGTYGHKDIAFEFGTWISPEFKLYLIIEFQRLKEQENSPHLKEWNIKRLLASSNFRILTDTVKEKLIPWASFKQKPEWIIYAEESDLINIAIFGLTAKQWREKYPEETNECKTLRDCADTHQLLVLANLEGLSSFLINQGITNKQERLKVLQTEAIRQLEVLNRLNIDLSTIESPNKKRITEAKQDFTEDDFPKLPFSEAISTISNAGKPNK